MARNDRSLVNLFLSFTLTLLLVLLFLSPSVRHFSQAVDLHECQRSCLENSQPKKCLYNFAIGISRRINEDASQSKNKVFLSINKKWPPPLISVCRNDTILVRVRNQLPLGFETALHFHGFAEGNSPFMDGVPMITQCPIYSHTAFDYHLKATKSGSFYYRSHSVAQQLDGIFGPIIVSNEKDQSHRDQIIVISPQMKNFQTFNNGLEADLKVSSLRVEVYDHFRPDNKGKEEEEEEENFIQRTRIVNAAALNCPVTLRSQKLPMKIIAIDGNNVKPKLSREITINPGERVDFFMERKSVKSLIVIGRNLCEGQIKYGLHEGNSKKFDFNDEELSSNAPLQIMDFESESEKKLEKSDVNIFLPYDVTIASQYKGAVDFRYKIGELTPYAPSFLSKNSVAFFQMRNKSFLYPPSPILSQLDDVPEDIICSQELPSKRCYSYNNDFCECLVMVNLPYNKNVDLFLIDEGKNNHVSQTVHVHGYSFDVLSSKSYGRPIESREIEEEEKKGQIKRNLINPVAKDTVLVPNKGFVVLRLKTVNPGKWLTESMTSKAGENNGFEVILNVEDPDNKLEPPENFPTCGSKKQPDLVLQ